MGWEVTSYIHGGPRYSAADEAAYRAAAALIGDQAGAWRNAAHAWSSSMLRMRANHAAAPLCPIASDPYTPVDGHSTLPYAEIDRRCGQHAVDCDRIALRLEEMADLLIRAHSLYEGAESAVRRVTNEIVQAAAGVFPGRTALGAAGLAAAGVVGGSVADGRFNPVWALTSTSTVQEGLLGGVASKVGGIGPVSGLARTDEVNAAADRIARVTAPIDALRQGGTLTVREVSTDVTVVGESHSVAQSLENLRRLAEERLGKIDLDSGLDYATIAIQRYERDDGTSSWLVTIPGTDGQPDSPFGWPQNVELMSDDPQRRMSADSARMVAEAMRQAGIGADEPVALIGHSQGGIVAATIAADLADEYRIDHVVTAGSPVANHPIPERTWVTSIEMEDELVAALDGAANPATEHWLTVRGVASRTEEAGIGTIGADGSCTPGDAASARANAYAGEPVRTDADGKEITHWIEYHQAAYRNASDLGSYALAEHERHFRETIGGTLAETHYYEGRMSH
ncbi:esterase/lipase family protein [Bifidobacterium samirii]|uniref:Alpha/beta hydrolase n=1 Tax=Bifidobacterium samirii TaxID=2306974 RepID=A0A430FPE6_9BIFI|nr:alpha/beta hydrolase [Bifidobacterium samirii]RSX54696.1 alpha/beta hydrolase [Bifidobacterium samirii]